MGKINVADAVRWMSGYSWPGHGIITDVTTDSRQVKPGSLFFALQGERTDGHQFVDDCIARGGWAVIKREKYQTEWADKVITVEDPLAALQGLAANYLRELDVRVVGITGSNGKTTTKDMIAAVLSSRYAVHKTLGNYNNEIGLPLTVLSAERSHDVLVLEMGMRGPGQISALTRIAPPDIAVITNIGPVHLELLGSLEAIARAKGEILQNLTDRGTAILNGDDSLVREQAARVDCRKIFFGLGEGNDYRAAGVRIDEMGRPAFRLIHCQKKLEISLPLPGTHNVPNALAACAVGHIWGVPLDQAAERLRSVQSDISRMRMEVIDVAGVTVINDAYNASPASMRSALTTLKAMGGSNRKIAVLGDMRELGELTAQSHREIGSAAAQVADWILYVGEYFADFAQGAKQAGFSSTRLKHFEDVASLARELRDMIRAKDFVLIKASRAVELERVLTFLGEGEKQADE